MFPARPEMIGEARPERVLNVGIDSTTDARAAASIVEWSTTSQSRYVCFATVHSVMEAHDCAGFSRIMNQADLVTPDGMPLVWGLRALGARNASRVYGPDLTPMVLEVAEREGVPVGFYGGSPKTLERFVAVVRERFPKLNIVYSCSPPYLPLSGDEDDDVTREINDSGARILFVGLGAPKQEIWMHRHRGRVRAVMLGVGAAFDFIAGTKRQAPRWMMPLGLEWLFRLATEPRRLWRRYLWHNPRFIVLFALQLLRLRFQSTRPPQCTDQTP